jgi:predicted MFS family arabinose efflux permease
MEQSDRGAWVALESIGYRRLFLATAAVVFGVMAQTVARGWLARDLTGSNAGLGGVMLVFGVTMLIATPWGGVAADRFNKRTVLFGAVLLLTLSGLFVGIAVELDVIAYWMLLVAGAVQAAAFAFFMPARIAFITDLVEPGVVPNAVVVAQIAAEGMRVVAPALAGLLIGVAWFGVGGVFLLGAALSVVSLLYVMSLPIGAPADVARRSPIGEMIDAVSYVRRTRGLGLIALTTIGVVMIGFPYMTFLPTLADDRYDVGASGYGLMSGAAGLGAVTAGVFNARLGTRHRPWLAIGAAGALFGVATIGLGLSPTYPVALTALFLIGGSGLVFQTTSQSLVLTMSSFEYHGRLQSMVVLGFSGFGLAALPLGLLADAVTLRATLVLMGAAVLAIVAIFALVRGRHRAAALRVELG